ncbi:CNH domain-containing protein [Blastomyces dermatitidis ER-3]|uniref:CNH domain-containing protein n=3 Tax=Blastomyces TaxID=229219 RepID=A0A179UJI0_BLAGS|nr:CNH domain-containing protein [Blastomyces gilchristii SLH14081]XP_045272552.1 CNH domain-containing protein [Blastomyces dermatitidis ER-3]EEQ84625.1 CNH domain-containing protein [Blastomyces dermatitidis ER-3]EGE84539.1 CNH domain-containing protein [Blastomyces dermatitidis ATCC 18188]OAT08144.1 CNH domain-containing protein [Blastomyces gilchristii SLH14081]
MAYPQNGQQHQHYHGLPATPLPQHHHHPQQQQQQHPQSPPLQYPAQYAQTPPLASQQTANPLRRNASFDAGDDRNYFDDGRQRTGANPSYPGQAGHGGGYAGYSSGGVNSNATNNLGSRNSQFSVGSSRHSLVSQASSQGSSALSGYQHQYQPPASTAAAQPSYNPVQFAYPTPPAHSQPGYNPQAFAAAGTATSTANTAYNSQAYQHYNPAAYQTPPSATYHASPTPSWQASTPGQSYGFSPQSQYQFSHPTTQHPQVPPPPPPRANENTYNAYSTPQYVDSSPRPTYGYSPNLPQSTSSVSRISSQSTYTAAPTSSQAVFNVETYGVDGSASGLPGRQYSQSSHPPSSSPNPPPHGTIPHESSPQPSSYASFDYRSPIGLQTSNAVPTPPLHQSHQTSPRRTDTLNRHPQSRPLPGPPQQAALSRADGREGFEPNSDDPMKQAGGPVTENQQSLSTSPHVRESPDTYHSHTNGHGHITNAGPGFNINYDAHSDDEDAEAAAGLAALQMAEEEDALFNAQQTTNSSAMSGFGPPSGPPPAIPAPTTQVESSSDSDYAQHDMGLYGGGYDAHLHYGDNPSISSGTDQMVTTSGSLRSSDRSTDDRGTHSDSYDYPNIDQDSIHPFPSHSTPARVDGISTGGLSETTMENRRMSFDHGDEVSMNRSTTRPISFSDTTDKGEPQDLFFHPGMSSRPLPPAPVPAASNLIPHLMPAGTYRSRDPIPQPYNSAYSQPPYTSTPDEFVSPPSAVPRSTSLSTHTNSPRPDLIIRSKTDADRIKLRQGTYETPTSTPVTLDLPTIPSGRRNKFNPTKLSTEQFRKCTEPWALSAIVAWIKELSEDETDLKKQTVIDAIVALFTHKVPTMNTIDAEVLGDRVVKNMLNEGVLIKDEEWVKFGPGTLSGVFWQISGQGCYSSRLHLQEGEYVGRCYSHHCMRTLKKVNLQAQAMEPEKKAEDWATFYKVGKEVFDTHSKKEIDRQNILHEIVTTEDSYIGQLDVLRTLYRDQLTEFDPPVINPKRLNKFLDEVFGKVDAVKKVNEDHLLAQLKYRQKEQGPFIFGFSDIFREWIRRAKAAYIDYAATFPNANYLVRREAETNMMFRQFLNQARDNKLSNRLSWDTYLKAPITRIQRYVLLLNTVLKSMDKNSEEKSNLMQAIEEIKTVAAECDTKVGDMAKTVSLKELGLKLQFRPEVKQEFELNLEHLEIIFQGDLQRPRTKRFNWVDIRAILFDRYLILAKIVFTRDAARKEIYDVSKFPIPMDLLMLESTNDDPVMKSSVRGITAVSAPAGRLATPGDRGSPTPGNLSHVSTNSSTTSTNSSASNKTLVPVAVLENPRDDKILYPFRIKHLGQPDVYTLYAPTAQNRQEWCEKIIEAKIKHAKSLHAQNAEPFKLRVLSDSAFAYPEHAVAPKTALITGTPLDRAIREVEARYEGSLSRPLPVCRASVNCATVFQQPHGRLMCAVGTDYGVYISEYNNPRGWTKAIPTTRVTQIAVFEEFNLFLLIADKSLIAHHLDVVCPPSGVPTQSDSQRRAPQKLSGNREVGFFVAGRMKDRALVIYKKRDGITSTFKALEPILQKSSSSRPRFMPTRRGHTEFFRDYDEFYIPADSYSINLFHSSLAISTSRGVEVLTLDKKQPWSVPNLRASSPEHQPALNQIGNRINNLRPLGMFRLSDRDFLVVFVDCAVYVDKYGDVNRAVIMQFLGRAVSACLYGKFLILVNEDFVEVRNAVNGRLRQVIAGRNVTLLDDAGNGSSGFGNPSPANFNEAAAVNPLSGQNGLGLSTALSTAGRTVKICMQHPEHERSQIVVELLENQGLKE